MKSIQFGERWGGAENVMELLRSWTRVLKFTLLTFVLTGYGQAIGADNFPTRAIRIVVAFAPGGSNDIAARILASPLGAALGQQVIVENRPGAGGLVGTESVARANADGYTLMVGTSSTHAVFQSLYPKLPYNIIRDFQPIARLSDSPVVLAVHPSLRVGTVKELIVLARARPGEINSAHAGTGSTPHLAAVLFEHIAKVKFVHIPYKGGGPASVAAVVGEVPVLFGTAAAVLPHLRTGRLHGLAVTGAQRTSLVPNLPTMAEGGLPGYEMINWMGMFAPAGTPKFIVDKIGQELLKIMKTPEIIKQLQIQGAEPSLLGTEEFTIFVKNEIQKWAKMVAVTGMKAE